MSSGDEPYAIEEIGGVTVIRLIPPRASGDWDTLSLKEELFQRIRRGGYHIVFDLSNVDFLPTEIYGLFVPLQQEAARVAAEVSGCRMPAQPMQEPKFDLQPDRPSALRAAVEQGAVRRTIILCGVNEELLPVFRFCEIVSRRFVR